MNACMHACMLWECIQAWSLTLFAAPFPMDASRAKLKYVVQTLPDSFANCCRPALRQPDHTVCAPPGEFSLMPWVVENNCLGKWLILTAFLPWAEWILRIRFKVGELRIWDGDPVLSDDALMTVMASCRDQLTINVRLSQLPVPTPLTSVSSLLSAAVLEWVLCSVGVCFFIVVMEPQAWRHRGQREGVCSGSPGYRSCPFIWVSEIHYYRPTYCLLGFQLLLL